MRAAVHSIRVLLGRIVLDVFKVPYRMLRLHLGSKVLVMLKWLLQDHSVDMSKMRSNLLDVLISDRL